MNRIILPGEWSNKIKDELSCIICKEFKFPFVTLSTKFKSSESKLCSAPECKHNVCVTCFTIMLSESTDCPVCRKEHSAMLTFDSEFAPMVKSSQSLLPPRSIINIVFGNDSYSCRECKSFSGNMNQLIQHYFKDCGGFAYYCPHCKRSIITKKTYRHHLKHDCINTVCEKDGCDFKLFPLNNNSNESTMRRLEHTERHRLCNKLSSFAFQISDCMLLYDDEKSNSSTSSSSFIANCEETFYQLQSEIYRLQTLLLSRIEEEDIISTLTFIEQNNNVLVFIHNVLSNKR